MDSRKCQTATVPRQSRGTVAVLFINPDVSRSGLNRCLVPSLKALRAREQRADKPNPKRFKDDEPGFVHVDLKYLPQMPDEQQRKCLFAVLDRATRWVYVEILADQPAASAQGFLRHLLEKAPFKISKILIDNGKEGSAPINRINLIKLSYKQDITQFKMDSNYYSILFIWALPRR